MSVDQKNVFFAPLVGRSVRARVIDKVRFARIAADLFVSGKVYLGTSTVQYSVKGST